MNQGPVKEDIKPKSESLTEGEFAGIGIAIAIGVGAILCFSLYGLRKWLRGPINGSNINVCLQNKVVAITGANTGIGRVTAHELSKKGARVILLCRNTDKAEAVASEIHSDTGNKVDVLTLDLAALTSVR